jgi:2-dehydropantoate 2-reductase
MIMVKPLKVVVLGAGSIGSLLGGFLALGKQAEVALIGRDIQMGAIQRQGLIVELTDRTETVQLGAYTQLDQLSEKPDLILLAVRAYQTDEALKQVISVFGNDIAVLTFQNGNPLENISKAVGKRNTIGGTTLLSAKLLEPGHVRENARYPLVVGELTGTSTQRIRQIRDAFASSALEVHISENIIGEIWGKMIVNSTSNTLTGATNLTVRQVFGVRALQEYSFAMVQESFHVADLEHVDLENISPGLVRTYRNSVGSLEAWRAFAEGPQPDIKLSMSSMLEKGIKTEVDYTNGYIANKAREHNGQARHHEGVVRIIHEIEQGLRKPSPENLTNPRLN